jgi:prepilin-type N-terminal cleavage/methylation domain-containing protein
MLKNSRVVKAGFTVTELIIAVVVIVILSTMTIMGYELAVDKATETLLASDLSNASGQLKLDQAINKGKYPDTLEDGNDGKGIEGSEGTTFQYFVNNTKSPKLYCLSATNSDISYYIDQASAPTAGVCPGDLASDETLIAKYDFDSDTVGDQDYPTDWIQYGDEGNVYSGVANDWSRSGSNSYKVSQSGSDMDGGIRFEMTGLTIGQDITLSGWIKTDSNVSDATLVLVTPDYSYQDGNNQGVDVDGWFSVTLPNITQTDLNAHIGLGSFYGSSEGTVWFDDITITAKN